MMGGRRLVRLALVVAAMIAAVSLSACGSISEKMAGPMSEAPAVGLPVGAPARPVEQAAYPAVHDMPPQRSSPTLTVIEQKQFEDDLLAARTAQQKLATAPPEPGYIESEPPKPAAKPEIKKVAKKVAKKDAKKPAAPAPKPPAATINPATSARSIY